MTLPFTPRPSQQAILRYSGGPLGIAAVPGAGKTHILSALAAQVIQSGALQDDQEALIVTLVNSAVDNFEARIKRFFDNPLQALYKYRVRTLHGLAHDIVREKPAHVGLEERFGIIDEREAAYIRREAVQAWLAGRSLGEYLDPNLDESRRDWVRRQQLPELVDSLTGAFIRSAKDRLLTPENLRARLDSAPAPLPLAELGWSVYADYQRALAYRGSVDFDDLIRLALTMLESDPEFLERLRYRYPFILEDEAQDSSLSQQRILGLLAGEGGNWVRVGDPNQAIFETFTTADPELLRAFIASHPHADMPESGRSQPSILALANHLVEWVMAAHPNPEARTALSPPFIVPVPAGDPQQNPPDDPAALRLVGRKYTPEEELEAVVRSIQKHLESFGADEQKPTLAVLAPRNARGIEVIEALKKKGLEVVELISSTSATRAAAGALNYLLSYLADPQSARKLARAYEVWRRDWRASAALRSQGQDPEPATGGDGPAAGHASASQPGPSGDDGESMTRPALLARTTAVLRKITNVEDFIAPRQADDWLQTIPVGEADAVLEELAAFRVILRRWLEAVTLPIDQLTLTLAQDIFSEPVDLALGHKLALALRQAARGHAEWRLPELTAELAIIARNERRFIGFSTDDAGFDPEQHRGRVVVTTVHKAKGLEWDRVYLMSANNYDFPSGMANDHFISERWFVRDSLNLEAEALAQMSASAATSEYEWYTEGAATLDSRLGYVKERLRLFYVGITRAKKDLVITWNTGRQGDATPCLAFSELLGWWEK